VRGFISLKSGARLWRAIDCATGAAFVSKYEDADRHTEETTIFADLTHPNILPLLESMSLAPEASRSRGVLVFPEREGDLGSFLARRRGDIGSPRVVAGQQQALSTEMVALWARQLAGALSYLHGKGIVHRNVKPSNVLLRWDPRGSFDVELGLLGSAWKMRRQGLCSRVRGKTAIDAAGRELRALAMTPSPCILPYAAPEICFGGWGADGVSSYSYAPDVWSFGTVLFELLTFELFVAGTSDAARIACVERRLGPFPPEATLLGPRQKACMEAACGAQVLSSGSVGDPQTTG